MGIHLFDAKQVGSNHAAKLPRMRNNSSEDWDATCELPWKTKLFGHIVVLIVCDHHIDSMGEIGPGRNVVTETRTPQADASSHAGLLSMRYSLQGNSMGSDSDLRNL